MDDVKNNIRYFDEILFYNKEELYNQVSFEKGEEKGKTEGKAEGKAIGISEDRKLDAINLLKKNLDIFLISELTEISIEDIKAIQK